MRRPLTAAVAVVATLAAPAAAGAALPDFSSKRIAEGASIGGVAIGQDAETAKAAWGGDAVAPRCGSDACTFTSNPNGVQNGKQGGARFYFGDGGVTLIVLEAPQRTPTGAFTYGKSPVMALKTSKGVKLGSTRKALKKAYGKRLKGSGTRYEVAGKAGADTEFRVTGKRVSGITVTTY